MAEIANTGCRGLDNNLGVRNATVSIDQNGNRSVGCPAARRGITSDGLGIILCDPSRYFSVNEVGELNGTMASIANYSFKDGNVFTRCLHAHPLTP